MEGEILRRGMLQALEVGIATKLKDTSENHVAGSARFVPTQLPARRDSRRGQKPNQSQQGHYVDEYEDLAASHQAKAMKRDSAVIAIENTAIQGQVRSASRKSDSVSRSQYAKLKEAIHERDEELKRLREENCVLAGVNDQLNESIVDQKHQLERSEDYLEQVREQLTTTTNNLYKLRCARSSNHDDTFFETQWKVLRYDISNTCTNCFRERKTQPLFPFGSHALAVEAFKRLTADHFEYLQHDGMRPKLVEAYIWDTLCKDVFGFHKPTSSKSATRSVYSVSRNLWSPSIGDKIEELNRHFQIPSERPEDYHRWRVATAMLLHGHPDAAKYKAKYATELADTMKENLKSWNSKSSKHLLLALKKIVQGAIDIDTEMQKQHAHYHVMTWDLTKSVSGMGVNLLARRRAVDREKMETLLNDATKPRNISLVVSPALIRNGNSDGERYDLHRVIAKAAVVDEKDFHCRDSFGKVHANESYLEFGATDMHNPSPSDSQPDNNASEDDPSADGGDIETAGHKDLRAEKLEAPPETPSTRAPQIRAEQPKRNRFAKLW